MRITQNVRLHFIIFALMLFPFTVSIGTVFAETRYVTDQLIITLREGMGNEYKIIKTLKTGTHLEILEESGEYLKVRTDSGLEGWVLTQYVTRGTPKPEIIADLEKKIDLLNAKIEQYKKDNEALQNELTTVKSDYNKRLGDLQKSESAIRGKAEQTDRALKEMSKKYNALLEESNDVVNLVNERDSLKASNSSLQTRAAELQREHDDLKRSQMIWWFVAGGGVFFVGWIIGKISRQKRHY